MSNHYPMTWDLDRFFSAENDYAEFREFLHQLQDRIHQFAKQLKDTNRKETPTQPLLSSCLNDLQWISQALKEATSYTDCIGSADYHNQTAGILSDKVKNLGAAYQGTLTLVDEWLAAAGDSDWDQLLKHNDLAEVAFNLNERRVRAKERLAPEMEALAADLAVDGYHAWWDIYNTAVGRVQVPFLSEDGKEQMLSAGQAANKLHHPDRKVREQVFKDWELAWKGQADLCAQALNRLAGFRLQLYKHRGWNDVMKEPLEINRMTEATLQAMWTAVNESKPVFVSYLQRKAQLLGIEKLDWFDVDAAVGQSNMTFEYQEAVQVIVDAFNGFSPKLAAFSDQAMKDGWIEAEDRAGKRPGGFCTGFPLSKETRIFMTYSGTASNLSTLAHELGHAFHQHVMDDMPDLTQDYAMNVAETASTLAELIVSDAMIKRVNDREEKLALLADKIQSSIAFYFNIQARLLFEQRFYQERRTGMVSAERLSDIMEGAQREAFGDALGQYHPSFWASKLHFYATDMPFYNFPYTFGYLFSAGIYAYVSQHGESAEEKYIALLRDTGRMQVEDLAKKHLGVDLTKPEFWRSAVAVTLKDVDQFLELTQ